MHKQPGVTAIVTAVTRGCLCLQSHAFAVHGGAIWVTGVFGSPRLRRHTAGVDRASAVLCHVVSRGSTEAERYIAMIRRCQYSPSVEDSTNISQKADEFT